MLPHGCPRANTAEVSDTPSTEKPARGSATTRGRSSGQRTFGTAPGERTKIRPGHKSYEAPHTQLAAAALKPEPTARVDATQPASPWSRSRTRHRAVPRRVATTPAKQLYSIFTCRFSGRHKSQLATMRGVAPAHCSSRRGEGRRHRSGVPTSQPTARVYAPFSATHVQQRANFKWFKPPRCVQPSRRDKNKPEE